MHQIKKKPSRFVRKIALWQEHLNIHSEEEK